MIKDMHRNDIENLLNRFGFSVTLNQGLAGVNLTHMMYRGTTMKKFIEYYVDDVLNTIKFVWAFDTENLKLIENLPDLEIWLKTE